MNTKRPIRKSKAPVSRNIVKSTPDASSTKKPNVALAPVKTGKSAVAVRSKVSPHKIVSRTASGARTAPAIPAGQSKQTRLISLLQAASGATIEQMTALTGWQAHTVRGAISGVLRKKLGLNVTCTPSPESGPRLYRIVGTGGGV